MEKLLLEIFNILAIFVVVLIPFFKTRGKAIISAVTMTLLVSMSAIVALLVFNGGSVEFNYAGSLITGNIPIRVDYLSAWFILIIGFTFLTGTFYGLKYMRMYADDSANLSMHAVAFILAFVSLVDLCIIQNGLIFLVFWEIMALSSFVLIIFEHQKTHTLRAGLNFLIQSHISILFLTVAFLIAKIDTGTFDFAALSFFGTSSPASAGTGLFLFFFCGFAIKAGFIPFHTWLPLAHPAAPAHISGIMSGVIIKIGIYGILRMLLLIKTDMIVVGYTILTISVLTGVYGVMLAIVQHNLKKLLAYHSIENIGIIGIGIGLGALGLGYGSNMLLVAGFGGALLHTLNHSLFKSLLFFGAGNVYSVTHSMKIDGLGGLIKKLPHTAMLFLIGSLAICGLPPFNGFVSEFFIYTGLFNGLQSNQFQFTIFILFIILGLVLIGGLAFICFTKAFGVVFLGNPREEHPAIDHKESGFDNIPLYAIATVILLIGIFPGVLTPWLSKTVDMYHPVGVYQGHEVIRIVENISLVGWYSIVFILITGLLFAFRYLITSGRAVSKEPTWGCGYTGEVSKMQYTASSFIRTYRKMAEPLLLLKKEKGLAKGLYPSSLKQETHPYDKIEKWLIDKPIYYYRQLLSRFVFLQNGNIQAYILYGFIFVGLTIMLPMIVEKIAMLLRFLNQL